MPPLHGMVSCERCSLLWGKEGKCQTMSSQKRNDSSPPWSYCPAVVVIASCGPSGGGAIELASDASSQGSPAWEDRLPVSTWSRLGPDRSPLHEGLCIWMTDAWLLPCPSSHSEAGTAGPSLVSNNRILVMLWNRNRQMC